MEIFNNTTKVVKDDLVKTIKRGDRISIAASCFSIYAYQELKKQLESCEELRFIFTSPTFVAEKTPKERREFYIPRLQREKSLYGTEFEVRLRNELKQKAVAKECADWMRRKVCFKTNTTRMNNFLLVDGDEDTYTYMPMNTFTTVDLGCERGNNLTNMITRMENPASKEFLHMFDSIWNDKKKLTDVTEEVINMISAVYQENSPELIYFMSLYNIFSEFLEDISEDVLPNEATGFKDSVIWNKLFNFQKDAALAIINKLEQYNGCILADSVGLGKTFTALAVIKYYEGRNKNVLVLCPKKLSENWMTYRGNLINNPLAEDRLRYDILYHTDLSRDSGNTVIGLPIDRINWGNYDLVVIDESHNFRNGNGTNSKGGEKENRYMRLMNRVIKPGVKTKVLMLSATPVNNRFYDLRNQLALAYEGDPSEFNEKLNIKSDIDTIFRQAQKVYNAWCKLPEKERTTATLLSQLDFDFFEVLDYYLELIRKLHIRTYEYLGELRASTNPLAYCEGGFYGGHLKIHDKIKPVLKSATASFGITALNEFQQLYNKKSLVEDGAFAIKTMEYINMKVNEFKKEDGYLYAIYGTPAENLCGVQVQQFRKKYGIVENVSDRAYVSNSFHCHVTEDITPIEKQDLENRFWDLCNGGKIQYVKYPINYNKEAIKSLVRRAMDMGFYEGVNLSLAYCDDCGHEELSMDVCPVCGSKNLTKIDRMNGYLSYSRVKGDTRLNDAKMAEIAERKSM